MTKKELRAAMKKQNLSLSPEERAAASGRIFRRVAESEPFGTARCVAFFCALPDEPETEEALARWGSARRIVVPRVGGDAVPGPHEPRREVCRRANCAPRRSY